MTSRYPLVTVSASEPGVNVFLKSIELFGFKSFADRSRLEFADGVSALLGPNGCGKSNIVDAIKWVLGEQATKSLRAERMEDVIFNGTEDRKALNVAEVTLTLSNDEGVLPVDMPEISVRRRLFRSGDSEYYINNTPVKLRELRELFYDTGIGKSAYSIMEQGKIDQVLSNKPEERRHIFEEAATITKYRFKGQEAERKLQRTEENMKQVESILGEVHRSYNALEKQAAKTEKFRQLRDRIFELEVDRELLRLSKLLDDRDSREQRLKDTVGRRDEVKTKIDSANERVEKNLDLVNTMEAQLVEKQKKLYGLEIEKGNLLEQLGMLAERRDDLQESIKADEARQKTLSDRIATAEADISSNQKEIDTLTVRAEDIGGNITQFRERIDAAEQRIKANDEAIATHLTRIDALDTETDTLQDELRDLTDRIVRELDTRLKESGYRSQDRSSLDEELNTALAEFRRSLSTQADRASDVLAGGTDSAARLRTILQEVASGLSTTREGFEGLVGVIDRFRATIPSFLDEFLAPEGTLTRKRSIDDRMAEIRLDIRSRRAEIEGLQAQNRELSGKISEYRHTLEELRVNRVQVQTQITSHQESKARIERELSEARHALEENRNGIARKQERLSELASRLTELQDNRKKIETQETSLSAELEKLEAEISKKNSDLIQREHSVKGMMSELARLQAQVEKVQIQHAESVTEIRSIYDNFRDRHSRELSEFESRAFEIKRDARDVRDELASVREEQRALGTVNLMAPEEFAEVKTRYEFLSGQLDDLKKAREDLLRVTEEIRNESAELFMNTFEKIKRNFHSMFRRLFGGGRAELRLSDPEDVLASGIDILAQPPGKKLENIALLSGGERSLTAVALLFATYMVKPSPFCLLDEIDAALDENNVGRFVSMLTEFGRQSQFIIITHNKKTVASASTLLGVTMEESGVSKAVAIRLDRNAPNTE
ncbi:MAG: chromosome segregation protein SMC [Spirochaetaceae bacterium]|nr:MAG: chromosome segregation protein SMC [Spirochaetaceae bacterium]